MLEEPWLVVVPDRVDLEEQSQKCLAKTSLPNNFFKADLAMMLSQRLNLIEIEYKAQEDDLPTLLGSISSVILPVMITALSAEYISPSTKSFSSVLADSSLNLLTASLKLWVGW